MTTRALASIDEWQSEPYSGGYAGLHDLVDDEFTGVVQSGTARLCLLGGTAVGILDGDIDEFEGGEGTAFHAPSPALPLLALMQERSDEVRAKYYTEDTPISEVDGTLSSGGFSGYVELSENVLSGDYYVVYHAGRSMSVAWVGNSGQLLTEDEAFDRADDEVGIYEVRPVDIEPIEIPEPESEPASESESEPSSDTAVGAAGSADAAGESGSADAAEESRSADDGPGASDEDTGSDAVDDGRSTTAAADATAAAGDGASASAGRSAEETGTTESADETTAGTTPTESGTGEPVSAESEPSSGTTGAAAATSTDTRESRSETDTARSEARESRSETRESTSETAKSRTEGSETEARRSEAAQSDSGQSKSGQREATGSATDEREGSRSEGSTDADARRTEPADTPAEDAGTGRREADERDEGSRATGERGDRRERAESAETRETNRSSASTSRRSEPETEPRDGGAAGQPENRSARGNERGTTAEPDRPTGSNGTARAPEPAGSGADDRSTQTSGTAPAGASPADRLETRSIPSLDPSRTTEDRTDEGGNTGAATGAAAPATGSGNDAATHQESPAGTAPEPAQSRESADARVESAGEPRNTSRDTADDRSATTAERSERSQSAGRQGGEAEAAPPDEEPAATADEPSQRVADLEAELEETEAELERLEADLADVERDRDDLRRERDDLLEERDALEAERDRLRNERDDLEAEVEELESELESLRSQLDHLEEEYGAATDAERRLSPGEALDQTNIFVRYESKGQATLESAHDGNASRQEVGENLGLEYHTQFEAGNVSVAGKSFEEFLEGTIQYRFVTWVVNDLLYEIRDTGKVAALQDLYDAIPHIDRAELNGVVSIEFTEDGQQRRTQESFDVVMRDRMGNALIVGNLNDSREAATESMMSSLVSTGSNVGESEDSLAASFLVTSSFFEPEALETAAEATSGGLLSRDKRQSFVKLSRKRGYHLCLAEAREGKFHLAVPEL